jgi:hypothetical protein
MGHLHETFDVPRGTQRFRELIIYVSMKCEGDVHFGATKLNKILYHADFRAFERFGVPLTGVRYVKLQNGPAPRALVPVRDELEREGALRVVKVPIGPEHTQHRTVALRDPVLSLFTPDEIAVVDEVISDLWHQNALEVSNASHDIRWLTLQLKDPMPYEMAYLCNEPLTEADAARTRELAAALGW